MGWIASEQLQAMGFLHLGQNVLISDKVSIYGAARIALADNVRIDDFCILSAGTGGITIGRHVHIAAYCSLIGHAAITLADYAGLSSRVSIYSSSDDYSGAAMTNPTVPEDFTNVQHAPVSLGRHVIVGCGAVILPGAILEEGVAVGALSLVSRPCAAFGIYSGVPARRVKERSRDLLLAEQRLVASAGG